MISQTIMDYVEKNYEVGFISEGIKDPKEVKIVLLAEPQQHKNIEVIRTNSEFISTFAKEGDILMLECLPQRILKENEYLSVKQTIGLEECISNKNITVMGWDENVVKEMKLNDEEKIFYEKVKKIERYLYSLKFKNVSAEEILKISQNDPLCKELNSFENIKISQNYGQKAQKYILGNNLGNDDEFLNTLTFNMVGRRTKKLEKTIENLEGTKKRIFGIAGSAHLLTIEQLNQINKVSDMMGDEYGMGKMMGNIYGSKEALELQKFLGKRKAVILYPKSGLFENVKW